ncbi:hypothetical protein, partial [Pseudomonas edaphica]|uniref:hypothetical protein n=1 Tax=Pseudomonas edaphica TaxID=2006980 RepID=UPI00197F4FA5
GRLRQDSECQQRATEQVFNCFHAEPHFPEHRRSTVGAGLPAMAMVASTSLSQASQLPHWIGVPLKLFKSHN